MKNNRSRWYALLLVVLSIMTPSVAQNTKYVNLFIGTSGDNGQVAPGAAAPFGMVCVCPDNDPRSHAASPEWDVVAEEETCAFVR